MTSIPENGPGQPRRSNRAVSAPRLSNFLSVLAGEVADAAAAYKRSSLEAHGAYLRAGAKLVEARGMCRRGEWGPFLQAAGVEPRTARNMMQLDRAGLTAEDLSARGGVQASLDALRLAAAAAVDAAEAATAGDGTEKPESDSGFSVPDEPSHDADSDFFEPPCPDDAGAPGAGSSLPYRQPDPPAAPARDNPDIGAGAAAPDSRTPAQRRRDERRDAGLCLDCGAECAGDGTVRCARCRARISASDKRRREDAKLGSVLGKRIREAARQGRGVRLTAADVAKLVGEERERFAGRLAKVGRGPKGQKRADSGAHR